MSATDRRFEFILYDGAAEEISRVEERDPNQADELHVILEELKDDYRFCECLIDVGYEDDQIKHVKLFAKLQREGFNVYTVRICEIDDWRIITAVDHLSRRIAVLYIMDRDEEYDDEVQRRAKEAYEALGFRKLGQR